MKTLVSALLIAVAGVTALTPVVLWRPLAMSLLERADLNGQGRR